jgi:hypothetical protein
MVIRARSDLSFGHAAIVLFHESDDPFALVETIADAAGASSSVNVGTGFLSGPCC